jgi:hypothetical protein
LLGMCEVEKERRNVIPRVTRERGGQVQNAHGASVTAGAVISERASPPSAESVGSFATSAGVKGARYSPEAARV